MKNDDDDDFGFVSMSEASVENLSKEKILEMYNMIMPLLHNLKKDCEKNEYIYWPNRGPKIDEFVAKLDKIIKS